MEAGKKGRLKSSYVLPRLRARGNISLKDVFVAKVESPNMAVIRRHDEPLYGARALTALGYMVESFWASSPEDVYAPGDLHIPATVLAAATCGRGGPCSPFEKSLRINWIHMLENAAEDIELFGESDAAPNVYYEEVLSVVHGGGFPYDIVRLFPRIYKAPTKVRTGCKLTGYGKLDPKDNAKFAGWGTHALYVPRRAREKLLQIFRGIALPTDCAILAADRIGFIKVASTSCPLFYQVRHAGEHELLKPE